MPTYITKCNSCGRNLKFDDAMVGKLAKCRHCKNTFKIERLTTTTQETLHACTQETVEVGASATKIIPNELRIRAANELGTFGKFKLIRILGQGENGIVYEARDTSLDRSVALKIPSFSNRNTQRFDRFIKEGRAAAKLRHKNIVMVYETGMIDGKPYISCELIHGQTMTSRIAQGPICIEQATRWIHDLALAIHYAHSAGIIHRDIKSDNILIDSNDTPHLTDFGLAKEIEESSQTIDGSVLGTPAYMPPEQASGDVAAVGPWSDQYSLGAVYYELLTGQKVFRGAIHEVLLKVLNEQPERPRSINPGVPEYLERICIKSLSKRPSDRYSSLVELADDLDGHVRLDRQLKKTRNFNHPPSRFGIKSILLPALSIGLVLLVLGAFIVSHQKNTLHNGSGSAIHESQSNSIVPEGGYSVYVNTLLNDFWENKPLALQPGSFQGWSNPSGNSWRWEGESLIGNDSNAVLWRDQPVSNFTMKFKVKLMEDRVGSVLFWFDPQGDNGLKHCRIHLSPTKKELNELVIVNDRFGRHVEGLSDIFLEPNKEYSFLLNATSSYIDVFIDGARACLVRNRSSLSPRTKIGLRADKGSIEFSNVIISGDGSGFTEETIKEQGGRKVRFVTALDSTSMLITIDDKIFLKEELEKGVALSPGKHRADIWLGGRLRHTENFTVSAEDDSIVRLGASLIRSDTNILQKLHVWNLGESAQFWGQTSKDVLQSLTERGGKRIVTLYSCELDQELLGELLKNAEELYMHRCSMSSDSAVRLDGFPRRFENLRVIEVKDFKGSGETVLQFISNAPNLERVCIRAMGSFAMSSFGNAEALTKLTHLELANCGLDGRKDWDFGTFENLSHLSIASNGLNSMDFDRLTMPPRVRKVNLSDNPLDDSIVSQLLSLPDLNDVDLSSTRLTETGIAALCEHVNLKKLKVANTAVSKEALDILRRQYSQIDFE